MRAPDPRSTIHVAIDARIESPGGHGGVEQFIIGLITGLSEINDVGDRYTLLVVEGMEEWVRPHLGPHMDLLTFKPSRWSGLRQLVLRAAGPHRGRLERLRDAILPLPDVPSTTGEVEGLGVDAVHFTFQNGFRTRLPNLFHPHDLQHVHFPEFFSSAERLRRDQLFNVLAAQATLVPVASTWTKLDVMENLGLPSERVPVVPLAPATEYYGQVTDAFRLETREKFSLPERFFFYPAQTWPHKNHPTLLYALKEASMRSGETVNLVCSGKLTRYFSEHIQPLVKHLELASQVRFLGFVEPLELKCLYRLCNACVIPSLFEAASFPIWEAFSEAAPVTCSNVTSLPRQTAGAALLFDPTSVDEMATALTQLWSDPALRSRLGRAGGARVAEFSWPKTARHFRAHYRQIAGKILAPEDIEILDATPQL